MLDQPQIQSRVEWVTGGRRKIVGSWRFKKAIDERMEAFTEELLLERHAMEAGLFDRPPRELPTEEQRIKGVEAACEWLGVESSQIWKWIARKNKSGN